MSKMQSKYMAAAIIFLVLFSYFPLPGKTSPGQDLVFAAAPIYTDSMGGEYQLFDIIPADLNGDEQKEQVVIYKGIGTSSLLSYQVWRYHEEHWLLWHEREALYQGIVFVEGIKLVERVPIHKKDDANATPGTYIERSYVFGEKGAILEEETERLIQEMHTSGDWQNPPREEIEEMIREIALLNGVPTVIVKAVAYTESNLRQFHNGEPLQSFDGYSWGIMQVSPHAHPDYDEEKLKYDIRYNIQAGTEIILEKWGYAFSSSPIIPKIGDNDPRILENYYFTLWAYNGWSQSNNPNMMPYDHGGWIQTEAYQDKVIRYAWEEFEQVITTIPPEELPEEGLPLATTAYTTPLPSHPGEFRTHELGDILISVSNILALRNDSWERLSPNITFGKGLEVLAGPVLHNGYIRYKIETIEEDGETSRTGWVAMNWAFPMPSADLNDDGFVDIYDLAVIAKNVGQPVDTEERQMLDMNYDGVIDEYDLLLAVRSYFLTPDVDLPGNVPLSYKTDRKQVNAGEEFTVDVREGYLDGLFAYELHAVYDPDRVQLLAAEDLDPLKDGGALSKTFLNFEDNGIVQFGKTRLSADEGLSGADWVFLRLHFKALADLDMEKEQLLAGSTARYSDIAGLHLYPRILGDVAGNGKVEVGDAVLVLRFIVGSIDLSEGQIWAANVSGTTGSAGEPLVEVGDAVLILRYIVGLIETFPGSGL